MYRRPQSTALITDDVSSKVLTSVCYLFQNFNKEGSDNYNYKGTHSMVLLGLCDARYRFTVVDIGGRGRRSDGGLFRRSALGVMMENGTLQLPPPQVLPGGQQAVPLVIVADDAFTLGPHIMTPFGGKFLPDEQNIFNYR